MPEIADILTHIESEPATIETGAGDTLASQGLLLVARIFFGLMTVMGLWLTYVGWRPDTTAPTPTQ